MATAGASGRSISRVRLGSTRTVDRHVDRPHLSIRDSIPAGQHCDRFGTPFMVHGWIFLIEMAAGSVALSVLQRCRPAGLMPCFARPFPPDRGFDFPPHTRFPLSPRALVIPGGTNKTRAVFMVRLSGERGRSYPAMQPCRALSEFHQRASHGRCVRADPATIDITTADLRRYCTPPGTDFPA